MASLLDPLQSELESIRVEFERYFMGLEKRPPYQRRDQVIRKIRRFDPGNNAVERFRHKNLIHRLTTLEQYWSRIQRTMDMGIHSKNVALADFRQSRKTMAKPTAKAVSEPRPSALNETESSASPRVSAVADAAHSFLQGLTEKKLSPKPKAVMRGTPRGRAER